MGGRTLCLEEPGRLCESLETGLGTDGGRGSMPGSLISSSGFTISVGRAGPLAVSMFWLLVFPAAAASGDPPRWMSLADVRPVRLELAPDRFSLESEDPGRAGCLTAGAENERLSVMVFSLVPSPIWPSTVWGAVLGKLKLKLESSGPSEKQNTENCLPLRLFGLRQTMFRTVGLFKFNKRKKLYDGHLSGPWSQTISNHKHGNVSKYNWYVAILIVE